MSCRASTPPKLWPQTVSNDAFDELDWSLAGEDWFVGTSSSSPSTTWSEIDAVRRQNPNARMLLPTHHHVSKTMETGARMSSLSLQLINSLVRCATQFSGPSKHIAVAPSVEIGHVTGSSYSLPLPSSHVDNTGQALSQLHQQYSPAGTPPPSKETTSSQPPRDAQLEGAAFSQLDPETFLALPPAAQERYCLRLYTQWRREEGSVSECYLRNGLAQLRTFLRSMADKGHALGHDAKRVLLEHGMFVQSHHYSLRG